MRLLRVLMLAQIAFVTLSAQWLNHPAPGTPRTKDGKPNLFAKAPRSAGKPDLSGVWQVEAPPQGDIEKMLGDITIGVVPGDPIDTFSKYFFNIPADFKPGESPLRPEGVEVMRSRLQNRVTPDERCLPLGVPRGELIAFPFKIVQTPVELVVLYETDNARRQIYIDGRQLPADPNPTWLGYSIGRWEGDTLVVDSTGFTDKMWIDTMGHPTSDALHVQERFHRRDFGHMDLQITVDDPKMYTKPFTFQVTQLLIPDSDILESLCNENEKDRAHAKE